MKDVLLCGGKADQGGSAIRLVRLQKALAAHGTDATCLWLDKRPPWVNTCPGLPQRVGSLADAAVLLNDALFATVLCHAEDYHLGVAALNGLGARLFVIVDGSSACIWRARDCTAIIANSDALRRHHLQLTDARVDCVHDGIDTEHFSPGAVEQPPAQPVVAWVAPAAQDVERVAAAAALLRRGGAEFWVVRGPGTGDLPPEVLQQLASHADRWHEPTLQEMPILYRSVAASHGCVLTGTATGRGALTVIEAQACGCPVAAPAAGEFLEYVQPDHGGLLYPPESGGAEVAGAVLGLLAEPDRLASAGALARDYVADVFGQEQMCAGYVRAFSDDAPRRLDYRALSARLRNWRASRRPSNPARAAADRLAAIYNATATELGRRGRFALSSHFMFRADYVAPWRLR